MKKRPLAHSIHPVKLIGLILLSVAIIYHVIQMGNTVKTLTEIKGAAAAQVQGPCRKTAPQKYDCTDQEVLSRLEARDKSMQSLTVYTTAYSRKSSCHNPRGKECLTAIGRDTKEGVTVACPRNIPLGTMVIVNSHWYRCEDRYATWLDKKRGLPTVDIFMENNTAAVQYGLKKTTIQVAHY